MLNAGTDHCYDDCVLKQVNQPIRRVTSRNSDVVRMERLQRLDLTSLDVCKTMPFHMDLVSSPTMDAVVTDSLQPLDLTDKDVEISTTA